LPQPITPNLNLPLSTGAPTARRANEDPRAAARRAFFEVAMQAQPGAVAPANPAATSSAPTLPRAPQPTEAEPPRRYARPGSLLDIWV
jgi:hypothetical protein